MTNHGKRHGLLAEYMDAASLVAAVRELRANGLTRLDAFTPYPIKELNGIILRPDYTLEVVAFLAGLFGIAGGYLLQYFGNAVSYPLNVGNRPLNSIPVFMPVTFEMMVLSAAIVSVLVLFRLMGLPKLHNPIFAWKGLKDAGNDRFVLFVSGSDEQLGKAKQLLGRAVSVSDVEEE